MLMNTHVFFIFYLCFFCCFFLNLNLSGLRRCLYLLGFSLFPFILLPYLDAYFGS